MKLYIFLLFLWPFSCFATAIYTIEQHPVHLNLLTVNLDRQNSEATELILSGLSMGIHRQIENISCDEQRIQQEKNGNWLIPAGCQHLHWQIRLKNANTLASDQQSIQLKNFILLSSVSSLAQLKNESEAWIKLKIRKVRSLFPKPNKNGLIALPSLSRAPLFILINANTVSTIQSDILQLHYFLDDPQFSFALPDIETHFHALKWLYKILENKNTETFSIVWLGITKTQMSLSGATGNHLLLANYPNDGDVPFGKAILLYIALHEAFHQFSRHYSLPPWVAESLASYYGARAICIALPHDENAFTLMTRLQSDGKRFMKGLIPINRDVQNGHFSEYAAFYTKGIAFWAAVDNFLQQHGDKIDKHLIAILQSKFNDDGLPLNLPATLNLSSSEWVTLQKNFLE